MSNFWDLVNIEEFWEKREDFCIERWELTFYCKDCEKIVEVKTINNDLHKYSCNECEWENIAIWTLEWIKTKYKIK